MFRRGEAEPSTRLAVSPTPIFMRNVKNASLCLLFQISSWHMKSGRAYSILCTRFDSSPHYHIMFSRAPPSLHPVCNVTCTSLPGDSYEKTPERRTQMAGRRDGIRTGKPGKEIAISAHEVVAGRRESETIRYTNVE